VSWWKDVVVVEDRQSCWYFWCIFQYKPVGSNFFGGSILLSFWWQLCLLVKQKKSRKSIGGSYRQNRKQRIVAERFAVGLASCCGLVMFQRTMAQKGNDVKVNKGQWGPMSRESFFWRTAKKAGEYKIYCVHRFNGGQLSWVSSLSLRQSFWLLAGYGGIGFKISRRRRFSKCLRQSSPS